MKVLQIKFSNGECWEIDVKRIAENRTAFYAKKDGFEEGDPQWQEEMDYIENDGYEAEDWMQNNMDWDEIRPIASRVDNEEEYDYTNEFFLADIKLLKK